MLAREKLLTICLYIPEGAPDSVEADLCAIIEEESFNELADLSVLTCKPERDLRGWLHSLSDSGLITVLIDTTENLSRSRAHQPLFAAVETPYLLALSAGVRLSKGWLKRVLKQIRQKDPFDFAALPPAVLLKGAARAKARAAADAFLMRTLYQRESQFPYYNLNNRGEDQLLTSVLRKKKADIRTLAAKAGACAGILKGIDPLSGFPTEEVPPRERNWFSVGLTGYGDFPQWTVSAAASLAADPELRGFGQVMVGCNRCSDRVLEPLRALLWESRLDSLIVSHHNFNKCGMQRIFAALAETPYLVIMDDDVEVRPGMGLALKNFIARHHPFYGGGSSGVVERAGTLNGYLDVQQFLESKAWWRGIHLTRDRILFPMGNFYVVSTGLLRRFNYPDDKMKVDMEDIVLGALIAQQGEAHCHFSREVEERIILKDAKTRR